MTLKSWLESSIGEANGDCILQMDIEGAEYECLLSTPSCVLRRFRIIVIEFHALDLIASKLGYLLIARTFEHLAADFRIVHIHPNNCRKPVRVSGVEIHPVIEVTLLRQDRIFAHSPSYRERHPWTPITFHRVRVSSSHLLGIIRGFPWIRVECLLNTIPQFVHRDRF